MARNTRSIQSLGLRHLQVLYASDAAEESFDTDTVVHGDDQLLDRMSPGSSGDKSFKVAPVEIDDGP